MKIIGTIQGNDIVEQDDGSVTFSAGATLDYDGANGQFGGLPCYAPKSFRGRTLDIIENAGVSGNWIGVVTDRTGNPVVQGQNDPWPGAFVSVTSLHLSDHLPDSSPFKYVDSVTVPFIAVPPMIIWGVAGVVLGCRCVVTNTRTGQSVEAVVADLGPNNRLGEISVACARAIGVHGDSAPSPSIDYQLFPGIAAIVNGVTYPLQAKGGMVVGGQFNIGGDKIGGYLEVVDVRGSVHGVKIDEIGGGKVAREEGTRLYTVWYGTSRQPLDPNDPSRGFSGQRSDEVNYGTCAVAIPRSHKFGSVGSTWWKRWLVLTDDRLYVRELRPQNHSEFWTSMRSAIAERSVGERHAVLYLHGYNTSFDEAAVRAAQIGFDLKVPGVMAFFSWPSQGSVEDYIADGASIEDSEEVIADFMANLATESGAESVDVIAHSMGNLGLLRALQRLEAHAERRSNVRFGQIFLAAPDIDSRLFKSLAYLYPQLSKRTTLYVSPADKALGASTWLHGAPRAGFTPPVTVVGGIDTIEVEGLDVTMLGHGYYAEADALLHDMFDLLRRDVAPTQRQRLFQQNTSGGLTYWSFKDK